MPVGTKATVKAVEPRELRELGAQIVLGNTYHLYFRPGTEIVAAHGGLHRFMDWDGPILTDSGGFQVFSLEGTRVMRDDGVEFSSVYDGSRHVFTPELAMHIQAELGADIVMAFDQCAPGTAPARGARGRRGAHHALGGGLQGRARPPRPAARRHRAGRRGRSPAAAVGRRDHRRRLRRLRHRRPQCGRARRRDARDGRAHGRTAAGRPPPLLHGHRRSRRHRRRDRPRRGRVRLRAARRAWRAPGRRSFEAAGD